MLFAFHAVPARIGVSALARLMNGLTAIAVTNNVVEAPSKPANAVVVVAVAVTVTTNPHL